MKNYRIIRVSHVAGGIIKIILARFWHIIAVFAQPDLQDSAGRVLKRKLTLSIGALDQVVQSNSVCRIVLLIFGVMWISY